MKVFVATEETQGERANDFFCAQEGELVTFGTECDGEDVDGSCGCRRAMSGVYSLQATTTLKVVEMAMTRREYAEKLLNSLIKGGWNKMFTDRELRDFIESDVSELLRLAELYEVGTVLEKRGEVFQNRT